MKERIRWIDWAKTICMFLVVLGHCHLSDTYKPITTLIYAFHMPLFFFLSGILCTSKFDYQSLKKDFTFIIIPYFTYGLLSILFNCILSHRLSFSEYYKDFYEIIVGYDCSIGPIWFLPALFFCKILFHLITFCDSNKYTKALFLIAVLLPTYYIYNYHINLPFFVDSGICALPFFYYGHESAGICKKIKHINPTTRTILFITFLCILVYWGQMNGSVVLADCIYGNNIIIYYFNAYIGIFLTILSSIALESKTHKIVYIMAYGSIVTLGFHGFILSFIHYYIPITFGYYKPSYSIYIALIYSIITYAICFCLIISLDKTKTRKLFGLKNGNQIIHFS